MTHPMPTPRFNPAAQITVLELGNDRAGLMVIDDLLLNADELVAYAADHAQFSMPPEGYYPGLTADISAQFTREMVAPLRGLIAQTFAIPPQQPLNYNGYMALTTLRPEELQLVHTLPHIDAVNPHQLAVLLYLGKTGKGATGFYKQRSTGFELLSSERMPKFAQARTEEFKHRAHWPKAYIGAQDPHYEQMAVVEARYNRLVVYHSRLLHSGLCEPESLSNDPLKGRLTANIFINPAL